MTVLVFGTFDPLHAGHKDFFGQAAALGTQLTVVVARDSWIAGNKQRAARQGEAERLAQVRQASHVDAALLGDRWPAADPYALLGKLQFDILALGYDQQPSEAVVRAELKQHGKDAVRVVRLQPYRSDEYKSSLLAR